MVSTTVYLVALLMSSLLAAIGKPSHDRPTKPPPCYRHQWTPILPHFMGPARTPHFSGLAGPHLYTTASKWSRGTRAEDEIRAFRKFPQWWSCGVNPWEMSDKYEGDMLVKNKEEVKQAIRDPERIWPNREIPYRINHTFFFQKEVVEIQDAIKEFNTFTCVKLRAATETDKDYILITGKKGGCWTHIGRVGGIQELNLETPVCVYKRSSVHHQFMHAARFAHEHNAPTRDKFIRLNWENIAADKKHFFEKLNVNEIANYGVEYDLDSIMHPSRKAFSGNNLSTIETLDQFAVIGQAKTLSHVDIQKVNIHYGCIDIPVIL